MPRVPRVPDAEVPEAKVHGHASRVDAATRRPGTLTEGPRYLPTDSFVATNMEREPHTSP